jgi:hypothetical protein
VNTDDITKSRLLQRQLLTNEEHRETSGRGYKPWDFERPRPEKKTT